MANRPSGLWRHPDFLKLWAGQTVSVFGSQITALAMPLTAALTLQADPAQMGLLRSAGYAPDLLVGLVAGVWVDRLRRRPILIATNLGRAALLLSVPAAAWASILGIGQFVAVAFLAGILTVFFDVADQSYLPTLVPSGRLVEGNAKLETSNAAAEIAGPGIAGVLAQAIGAPAAILVDTASFVASSASLGLIRTAEPAPSRANPGRSVWGEIGEGLGAVLGNDVLRVIALTSALVAFFANVQLGVYVLFVTRELGIAPAVLGAVYAVGNVGALAGALAAGRVAHRVGWDRRYFGRGCWRSPAGSCCRWRVGAGGWPCRS